MFVLPFLSLSASWHHLMKYYTKKHEALKRLGEGLQYGNNPGLCGVGFSSLKSCSVSDSLNPGRSEPYGAGAPVLSTKNIPETADVKLNCTQTRCSHSSKTPQASVIVGVIVLTVTASVIIILTALRYRRKKQKLGSTFGESDCRLSTDQTKELERKNGSPLISLEYSKGWDPLARFGGATQEILQSFRFNLEEVESATQHFAPKNLLGKSAFSAIHRGTLRDGTAVVIKSITKSSCKSEDVEFLKGLNILTSLRHDNLVRLRGFCCSKGRGECFLVYDFVSNGNLLWYLDVKEGGEVLEWPTRVAIINGLAKGIEYLHGNKVNKPTLVHQNISAKNVLLDKQFKPLLSDSGLHKLLTNDTVFSALKASAAMGYLAPEYTTTGKFTDKSDVYAFGILIFQIISGKRKFAKSPQFTDESCTLHDFVDSSIYGRFSEQEAAKLAKIALLCTHECPDQRPSIEGIVQELGSSC